MNEEINRQLYAVKDQALASGDLNDLALACVLCTVLAAYVNEDAGILATMTIPYSLRVIRNAAEKRAAEARGS